MPSSRAPGHVPEPVTFEKTNSNQAVLRWNDRGIPQVASFDVWRRTAKFLPFLSGCQKPGKASYLLSETPSTRLTTIPSATPPTASACGAPARSRRPTPARPWSNRVSSSPGTEGCSSRPTRSSNRPLSRMTARSASAGAKTGWRSASVPGPSSLPSRKSGASPISKAVFPQHRPPRPACGFQTPTPISRAEPVATAA